MTEGTVLEKLKRESQHPTIVNRMKAHECREDKEIEATVQPGDIFQYFEEMYKDVV